MIISCSWDDGLRSDINVTDTLKEFGLKATFYLVGKQIRPDAVRQYGDFEIGNHTMDHSDLTKCSPSEALSKIMDCQKLLEDVFGKKVCGFCYPFGRWNEYLDKMILDQGFSYTRICENFSNRSRMLGCMTPFDNQKKFWQTYEKKRKILMFYGHSKNLDRMTIRKSFEKMVVDGCKFITHFDLVKTNISL